jgi:hypothetical protein
MFTVLNLDDFVPKEHPLRPIRTWLNDSLKRMDDVSRGCTKQTREVADQALLPRS